MNLRIVRIRERLDLHIPVHLMHCDTVTQARHDRLVVMTDLVTCLQMICCNNKKFDVTIGAYCFERFADKPGALSA